MPSVNGEQKKGESALFPARKGVGLLFFLFMLVSCSVDLPSYVISEGMMEKILYDYHMAQGMAEAEGGDVEANRYLYVQKVFEKYHVTEAEFDTSMVWYSGHTSHLLDMYKRMEARLERESREAGLNIPEEDKFARFTAEGDTANIWQGREMLFLHGNREENLYTLVMPADTAYRQGDYFMFRCGNRFITQDRQREAFVLLQVKYENDSVVATTSMISGDYDLTLNLPQDKVKADCNIKSVSCTFYYSFDESAEDAFRLWVVQKPVLLRYHAEPEDTVQTAEEVTDTLDAGADTVVVSPEQGRGERLRPEEFRKNQQVERKIDVVEKRRNVQPSGGLRRRTVKSTR
jgi:hypothetical protein